MLFQAVVAHPLPDSLTRASFRAVVETLEAAGHEVAPVDLYAMGFAPAMTAAERAGYHAAYDASAVAELADLLGQAEGLIFCFPQWWYGMPAILKGYFDRVWAPGIAFAPDGAGAGIRSQLDHVRVFGAITSYGTPWWLARIAMGDPCRKVFMRAFKSLCPNARGFWLPCYGADALTPEARAAFLERTRRKVAQIAGTATAPT